MFEWLRLFAFLVSVSLEVDIKIEMQMKNSGTLVGKMENILSHQYI